MEKIALITGGSKGIGKALAEEFARHGYALILIARDQTRLQQAQQELHERYKVEVKTLVADLEQRSSIDLIINTFKDELDHIEVLVNNAGFGMATRFIDAPLAAIDGMMAVNMVALTDLTYKILPLMVARKRGKILNVASTAAFTPGPFYSIYYATKAYVLSFSMSLAEEYKADGITVSVLCPGMTESEFHERSLASSKKIRLMSAFKMMSTQDVARAGYQGLMRGKTVIVPGLLNKLSVIAMNVTPLKMKTHLTAHLNKPKKEKAK